MRLNEFESSQPEVGDILEIEIANEIVETVIVGINRGNYIVESTNTDLLESKLNEVDPRNYDSDIDYYDAVRRSGRRPSNDDYEPSDPGPSDEDIYYAKQKASMASAPQQRQVDGDGQAPNGQRYNTVVTFTSADNNRNKIAADSYKDYHWGAKKVVDSKNDNGVYTLYVVDNHKHGMWKPWKDQPAEGVNEVSTELRNRYVTRASSDYGSANFAARASKGHPGLDDYSKEQEERAKKRAAGLNRALSDKRLGRNQGMAEGDNPEYDDEAGMAQSNLRTMARAVDGLINTIKDNDNLPEWAQEKIAKAEMMTTGVWDYLLSQKEQGLDPKVESKQRLDPKCWDGYKKQGTKMKGDTRVNNCVKESLDERAEKKEKVKVYVKNPKTGRVVKVDFGEPGQLIKKSKKHRKHGKKRWNLKK
jgi:hypothetical protein